MDATKIYGEVFEGVITTRRSSSDAQDALIGAVHEHFPSKPYCLTEDWIIFHVDVSVDDLAKIHAAGHLPLFIFAHKVVHDSRGRFQPGDWVRSSMAISFDGVMFETKNTVYVLMGDGQERVASLKTIFSFF
ncbi:hypothetical protein ABH905_002092 [Pseudomonas frederiksbergensis]|uniref:DUF6957 family protein n=1 Tax=Pseudomonas frederiksbergensis TaxID=104087 RepID=UPI003D193CDA